MPSEAALRELLESYEPDPTNLLDILHDVQAADERNHLSRDALREVADYVGLPTSSVISSATFYSMFSLVPRGRHILRICESPPCQLVGAESLLDLLIEQLGVDVGETTEDGAVTLETSSCLGVCGVAPAMMIDEELYGNLTKERLTGILEAVRGEADGN
jgi:NADH-quinone oxidoreductase subunit E